MEKFETTINCRFFVNAAGEKVVQPIVIWKSKIPRCFKKLQDPSCPANVHYFSNPKFWMTPEVMEAVLARFNRKLVFEDGKVTLFLDNTTCHPESMIGQFSQIKIIFLLKNTTSRLQPLNAGIIQNFKVKYQKRLVKYVLAKIQEDVSATQIVKGVHVLVAIRLLQEARKEVTNLTIKNCSEKFVIKGDNELMEVKEDDDLEFEALVKEFTTDISATEYANFDEYIPASEPMINEFEIDWRQRVREESIDAIQNPEIASDQVEEIPDDDRSNDENDKLKQESMGFKEINTMLDKMKQSPTFDDDSQDMLSAITKRIEDL